MGKMGLMEVVDEQPLNPKHIINWFLKIEEYGVGL